MRSVAFGQGGADFVGCQPASQLALAFLHVIDQLGCEALLARQLEKLLQMLQCQRRFVQGLISLPDDLFGVHIFRVQPLRFFECWHRLVPFALLGIGVSQVGADGRIRWVEPPGFVPKGNCLVQFALFLGAFPQA